MFRVSERQSSSPLVSMCQLVTDSFMLSYFKIEMYTKEMANGSVILSKRHRNNCELHSEETRILYRFCILYHFSFIFIRSRSKSNMFYAICVNIEYEIYALIVRETWEDVSLFIYRITIFCRFPHIINTFFSYKQAILVRIFEM